MFLSNAAPRLEREGGIGQNARNKEGSGVDTGALVSLSELCYNIIEPLAG
jgi:hypothetical protein